MKLCAHLGFQFTEFDGLQRLEQAARAGFECVEWPAIYGYSAQQLSDQLQRLNLAWAQVTLPPGDAARSEKGIAALPGRQVEFSESLDRAITYAAALGAKAIHPLAGVGVSLHDRTVLDTYIGNLRLATNAATEHGMTVMVEVISPQTVPGYAMCSYELAAQVFDEVPGLALILDSYHASMLHGDPAAVAQQWAGRIGHVQIADAPGRHEPGTGAIDFARFLSAVKAAGYDGWVGCEYHPQRGTLEGLSLLDGVRAAL